MHNNNTCCPLGNLYDVYRKPLDLCPLNLRPFGLLTYNQNSQGIFWLVNLRTCDFLLVALRTYDPLNL